MEYCDESKCWLERVDDETLDDSEWLESLDGKPVTVFHPDDEVTPDNIDKLSVGVMLNPRFEDGDNWVDLMVQKRDGIDAIQVEGMRAVSPGYVVQRVPDPTGEAQYIQRKRRANHVAILHNGQARGGPRVRMHMDSAFAKGSGFRSTSTDTKEPPMGDEMKQALEALGVRLDALTAKVDAQGAPEGSEPVTRADLRASNKTLADMLEGMLGTLTVPRGDYDKMVAERDALVAERDSIVADLAKVREEMDAMKGSEEERLAEMVGDALKRKTTLAEHPLTAKLDSVPADLDAHELALCHLVDAEIKADAAPEVKALALKIGRERAEAEAEAAERNDAADRAAGRGWGAIGEAERAARTDSTAEPVIPSGDWRKRRIAAANATHTAQKGA